MDDRKQLGPNDRGRCPSRPCAQSHAAHGYDHVRGRDIPNWRRVFHADGSTSLRAGAA